MRIQDVVEQDFDVAVEALNERLRKAIEALEGLPGKTEIVLSIPSNGGLVFGRAKNSWSLWFVPNGGDIHADAKEWHKCSVEEKSCIATALPKLLEVMLETSAERKTVLKNAHDGMDRFEAMLKQQKEGA